MDDKEFSQTETPKYATLLYDVRRTLEISWVEYIILDMIYHLQGKLGYCYKSSQKIGQDLGEDKRTVQYLIQKLIKRGFIERLTDYTMKVTDKYIDVAIMGGTKNSYGVLKSAQRVQPIGRGVQKNVEITGGKNNIRITKSSAPEKIYDKHGIETLESAQRRIAWTPKKT